ncbi:hypothetical protein A2690_00225 [Candidatus Roizmanbacteria bacterium RIFCSPHIGHO2_01_FULL_39_12b]|uniref:Glycosyl transferase family 1 domain-containing protein n=1 Tax=Candidatus Roizmanbacteria bacterium RIFCSPHIGHO2_01_FULL_39_12b TaxID=1802030 RepID=A0A1F7G8I7_9BACT|nr:MAG: hypothetical protein A2690_00225 [Candidatus Roizmanbacteria bacterium RIFCSPHIGHO2_01_FULL_39_12b]OGK45993.1 MAG: hypothetical protein A3B46_00515 [Candidatus Roizmanbacteria bacterium RIFCSPLOWO2_01_FULL_39_19]
MKKTAVLMISEYYVPHWTGIVITFHEIAKNLIFQGYDMTVLTTKYDNKIPHKEVVDGVNIIRVPYFIRLSRTHYSIEIIFTFLKILSRFQTIVINSPNSNILFFTVIAKLFGKKVIIYHQGDLELPHQTGNQLNNRVMEIIFDVFTIPSFLLADKAVTYTRDYAVNSRVMKYSLDKFQSYIPFLKLPNAKPSQDFIRKTAHLRRYILIGLAGRFVEEKGYDVLLKAIPGIAKKIKNVRFVFAGATNMEYESFFEENHLLIKKNKDNLVFLGLLSRADLKHFYKMLDVFVISSRSDCFPTTQIEAALQGVPIVVTDIPGARMLVKTTGFGEIVEGENIKALEDGVVKIIKNKEKYNQNATHVSTFIKNNDTFKLY